MKNRRKIISLSLLVVVFIFGSVLLIRNFSIDRTAERGQEGSFIIKGEEYVSMDIGFSEEGKTIAKAANFNIMEITEDSEKNFLAVRSFLENWTIVKKSYDIPSGDVNVAYIGEQRVTDGPEWSMVESIIKHDFAGDFAIINDNETDIYNATKEIFVGYGNCPVGTDKIGVCGNINGQLVYIAFEDLVDSNLQYRCFILKDEFQNILKDSVHKTFDVSENTEPSPIVASTVLAKFSSTLDSKGIKTAMTQMSLIDFVDSLTYEGKSLQESGIAPDFMYYDSEKGGGVLASGDKLGYLHDYEAHKKGGSTVKVSFYTKCALVGLPLPEGVSFEDDVNGIVSTLLGEEFIYDEDFRVDENSDTDMTLVRDKNASLVLRDLRLDSSLSEQSHPIALIYTENGISGKDTYSRVLTLYFGNEDEKIISNPKVSELEFMLCENRAKN
ncbi:MAG: hypothetical protein PHD46_00155 [Eubacteriales bacterium]|nr:hypothetical protein [Eubacteriales bacterium]MDD4421428.1 hypothetical protein [Eubacteriales bacterium]